MPQTDTYLHKGLRRDMCAQLRAKGITNEAVLHAMETVPRHWFVDSTVEHMAYEDRALPIGCDQTISQPSTVAFQSQLLDVSPRMKVLEIGTGSGYQSAVLVAMKARVFTIERQKALFVKTKRMLYDIHCNAHCYLGDGYQGLTEVDYTPFDRIIITCGAPYIPDALVKQLATGGIMVIPVGGAEQEMLRVVKRNDDGSDLQIETFGDCRFVPMLSQVNYRRS